MQECKALLPNICLQDSMHDIWIWDYYHDNMLLVKLYDLISNFEEVVDSPTCKITWNLLVSLKTSLFA